jgi:hypothetical protein
MSGSGELKISHCHFENHGLSTTNSTISAGVLFIFNSRFISTGFTTTSTGVFQAENSLITTGTGVNNTLLTHGGSSSNTNIDNCRLDSGTSTTVVVNSNLQMTNCVIASGNSTAISGSATMTYCSLDFVGAGSGITCSLLNRNSTLGIAFINNNCKIYADTGSPSGVLSAPKGSLYLRTDGSSTSTRAYINTNGGTTWTAITTVA